jgi:hypothetical protein
VSVLPRHQRKASGFCRECPTITSST